MRLGSCTRAIWPRAAASAGVYGSELVQERHRHRYEFNNQYRQQFAAHGMVFSGTSPDGKLVEVIELPAHPWFVAVQCHPEFRSKPTQAHPLFRSFVEASLKRRETRKKAEAARSRAAVSANTRNNVGGG